MKKAFSVLAALTAVVMLFACTVTAGAATPIADTDWQLVDGTTADMYTINDDGSVSISYRAAGVTWANCAILYKKTSDFGSSYTVEVQFKKPELVGAFIQGCPVIGVNCATNWVDGFAVKFPDYSNHASPDVAPIGNCWEIYDPVVPVTNPVAGNTSVVYADVTYPSDGWNNYKAVVNAGKVTVYLNGEKILDEYTMASAGTMVALGTNGDCGDADHGMTTYRNFKIYTGTNAASASNTYTAFGTAPAGPADAIDVIAVSAAAVIALAGVAFVLKLRKA